MKSSKDLDEQLDELLDNTCASLGLNNWRHITDHTKAGILRIIQQEIAKSRIDEREGMQFFDDHGEETFKPYLQYRYTGGRLKLSWEDRTNELSQTLKEHKEVK